MFLGPGNFFQGSFPVTEIPIIESNLWWFLNKIDDDFKYVPIEERFGDSDYREATVFESLILPNDEDNPTYQIQVLSHVLQCLYRIFFS